MPWYHREMERVVTVDPKDFGPGLRKTLHRKLNSEVEGTCSGKHGYISIVTNIVDAGMGRLQIGSGKATFMVKYKCLTFRPFKGDVLDCVVSQINKMGFFADAGPFTVFVSSNLIPEDYQFVSGGEGPSFVSGEEDIKIERNCEVRVRIVGTRVDATEIFGIGTIKEDYLGLLAGPEM